MRTGEMGLGDQIQVRITREPGQAFEITATAGNESQTATLPVPPTTKFIEEIRYSDRLESRCSACRNESLQSGSLAIRLPYDEVIKPRSEYIDNYSAGSAPNFSPHTGAVYSSLDIKAIQQCIALTICPYQSALRPQHHRRLGVVHGWLG
jgi:hypothetical protein